MHLNGLTSFYKYLIIYKLQQPRVEDSCFRGCEIYEMLTRGAGGDDGTNETLSQDDGGMVNETMSLEDMLTLADDGMMTENSLGSLEVTILEGRPFRYVLSVPEFNSSRMFYIHLMEESTNRIAFRRIVRTMQCPSLKTGILIRIDILFYLYNRCMLHKNCVFV